MNRLISRAILPILFVAGQAAAQGELPEATETAMQEVVVTGEFPGPGLWKVQRADDAEGHVLWIAGDPWPLPKRLSWKSREIEATAASAQEILRDTRVSMEADEKIGFFRGVALMPALMRARRNPGDAKLEELLPADLYARWLVQKKLYLGRERGVEKWRPLFAADRLRKAALEELRMREDGVVWEVVGRLAKKRGITVTTPAVQLTFQRSELRQKLREFSRESLADRECFATTLDFTEALANRDVEEARARAWARGDLEQLTSLPALPSPYLPCIMAVVNSQVARELIPADIREQVYQRWIEAAERSLAENSVTFAVVPFGKLTATDGYLARLREKGYRVDHPR